MSATPLTLNNNITIAQLDALEIALDQFFLWTSGQKTDYKHGYFNFYGQSIANQTIKSLVDLGLLKHMSASERQGINPRYFCRHLVVRITDDGVKAIPPIGGRS